MTSPQDQEPLFGKSIRPRIPKDNAFWIQQKSQILEKLPERRPSGVLRKVWAPVLVGLTLALWGGWRQQQTARTESLVIAHNLELLQNLELVRQMDLLQDMDELEAA